MKSDKGQSIIELVIAIAVLTLLVTGLLNGTVASLKANFNARARSEAAKLVQEQLEFARDQRNSDWNTNVVARKGSTFCVKANSSPPPDLVFVSSPCSDTYTLNNIVYTRTLEYTEITPNEKYQITSKVSWNEGSEVRSSVAETYFTKW